MVDRFYIGREAGAEEPAERRHEALEASEPESGGEGVGGLYFPEREPLADGDRERVHGEPDSDQENFKK